jgi:biopolymer transport protein TolR
MAMQSGSSSGVSSEVNVTPMIDILLVLLIIFMVIVPAMPMGERALAPKPAKQGGQSSGAVVLEVLRGAGGAVGFRINQQDVSGADLQARLTGIFANRADRVLFLKADDKLAFTQVAGVIDLAHAAGIDHVGLLTPGVEAGI